MAQLKVTTELDIYIYIYIYIYTGADPGLKKVGVQGNVRSAEGAKRGVNCFGGGGAAFDVFLDKTLEMVQFWDTHNLILSETGSNEINPKVRHATSYEFSIYNMDFGEEYGLWPCAVLIRIC